MKRYSAYIIIIFFLTAAISVFLIAVRNTSGKLPVPNFLKPFLVQPTIYPDAEETKEQPSTADAGESVELEFSLAEGAEDNLPPVCTGLSADKTSSVSPFSVNFTGAGEDQDEKISAFEFDFGDGKKEKIVKTSLANKEPATVEISHVYTKIGTFTASLKLFDNQNAESLIPNVCQLKITVSSAIGGPEESQPAMTPSPAIFSPTPAPTARPTFTPSPTKTSQAPTPATEETIEAPIIPEAGGFLPTLAVILGGGAVVILAILL